MNDMARGMDIGTSAYDVVFRSHDCIMVGVESYTWLSRNDLVQTHLSSHVRNLEGDTVDVVLTSWLSMSRKYCLFKIVQLWASSYRE
jgi:hypothetical protein